MKEQLNTDQFDNLFREGLENAATPVPGGVWEGISSSMGASAGSAGIAVKTALWMKVAIGAITVASVAALVTYQVLKVDTQLNDKDTPVNSKVNVTAGNPEVQKEQLILPLTETNNSKPNTKVHASPKESDKPDQTGLPEVADKNTVSFAFPSNILSNNKSQDDVTNLNSSDPVKPAKEIETLYEQSKEDALKVDDKPNNYLMDTSKIVIPNVVTANGDGVNDSYSILLIGEEKVQIMIFNKNNELLFQTNNKYESWNCRLPNGEPAPAGFYLVKVVYKFKDKPEDTKYQQLTLIK